MDACEKFRVYILGGLFEIITDHKRLVHLLNNAQLQMPLRIERWNLRLQEFDFTDTLEFLDSGRKSWTLDS